MQARFFIKNPKDLENITEENLFISESGYAYSTDEILDFIKGGRTFSKYSYKGEVAGSFRDFKNKEIEPDAVRDGFCKARSIIRKDLPLAMFTETDIKILLMKNPAIIDAFKSNAIFDDSLKDFAVTLEELGTLNLINIVARKAQLLENEEGFDQDHVDTVLHDSLKNLFNNIQALTGPIKKMLNTLTSTNGSFKAYSEFTRDNFAIDIEKILTGNCAAGFSKRIAILQQFLVSYLLYGKAISNQKEIKIDLMEQKKIYSDIKNALACIKIIGDLIKSINPKENSILYQIGTILKNNDLNPIEMINRVIDVGAGRHSEFSFVRDMHHNIFKRDKTTSEIYEICFNSKKLKDRATDIEEYLPLMKQKLERIILKPESGSEHQLKKQSN